MTSVLWRGVAWLLEGARRVVLVLGLCLWFGGFTFYSLVVIHTGHRVFDNRLEVGFLTQAVTRWLNLIGVVVLGLMLWNVFAGWKREARLVRGALLSTWLVAAAIEGALFVLHPKMGGLLDAETRSIVLRHEFKGLYLLYMNLSTTQWVATILYICAMVWGWRRADQTGARAVPGT